MDHQEKLTVIVVDDVESIRQLLVEFINQIEGVRVLETVATIAEALNSITKLQPHVVMLDISMPSFGDIRNGIDVLRWIKQHHPVINVIMLTNHSESIYREVAQKFGAYAFLDKAGPPALLQTVFTKLVKVQTDTLSSL